MIRLTPYLKTILTCKGCNLRSINALIELISTKEAEKEFLANHNLIKRTSVCDNCGTEVSVNDDYAYRCQRRWRGKKIKKKTISLYCRYKKSAFVGSYFEESHLSIRKILLITYHFVNSLEKKLWVSQECAVSQQTVAHCFNLGRKVLINYLKGKSRKIGGVGKVVEIGEMKVEEQKFRRDVAVKGKWAFGGIDKESKEVFLVVVDDRSKETLKSVVEKYVCQRSEIQSSCLGSYQLFEVNGYVHKTIEQCKQFDYHPAKTHQNIVGAWWDHPPKRRRRKMHFDGDLVLYLFRQMHQDHGDRFHTFLLAASSLYQP